MNYVEWLRVRNTLRIYAIVLGVLIVVALIVRIWINGQLNGGEFIVNHVEHEAGTVVTHSVVNGLNRTTLVNPKERTTITVDDQADGGKLIHIVEPADSKSSQKSDHGNVGSFKYDETTSNGMKSITFNTDGPVNVVIFLIIASFAALIFATIWGGSFACELPHLEFALLKPVTRTRYALGLIGVDLLGIALVAGMTIVAAIICQAMFEVPHFDFSHVADPVTLLLVLVPVAWYAALNAATASMRRGIGAVIGFAWPVAFVVISLTHIPLGDSPVGSVFHTIFVAVSRLIPITYLPSFGSNGAAQAEALSEPLRLAIIIGLTLIYGALALVQWRRVEA